jgi:hypothetical protein
MVPVSQPSLRYGQHRPTQVGADPSQDRGIGRQERRCRVYLAQKSADDAARHGVSGWLNRAIAAVVILVLLAPRLRCFFDSAAAASSCSELEKLAGGDFNIALRTLPQG